MYKIDLKNGRGGFELALTMNNILKCYPSEEMTEVRLYRDETGKQDDHLFGEYQDLYRDSLWYIIDEIVPTGKDSFEHNGDHKEYLCWKIFKKILDIEAITKKDFISQLKNIYPLF